MIDGKKIISIIPARGGSKRIIGKNIIKIGGKPLVYHSIRHSLQSEFIDRTIVSTDDPEIKKIALKYGAEVFDRPRKYSGDKASTLSVLKNVISQLRTKEKYDPDMVVLLQPTSPIRQEGRIDQAIRLYISKGADMVVSVEERSLEPRWILKEESNRQLGFMQKNDFSRVREQDQKKYYELNGSITMYSTELMMSTEKYVFGKKTYPLVMSKIESFQLDTQEDLKIIRKFLGHFWKKKFISNQ